MALTPAAIENRTENVLANKIGLVSYDENALGHDVYRRTNASMEGDPEANGERVGVQIDPTEDFVDPTIETGNTYHYAVISRTQLDPIGSYFKMLKDNDLMHVYDNADLILLPDSPQHEVSGMVGDYKYISKIISLDPSAKENTDDYYVKDNYFRVNPTESLGSQLVLPALPVNPAGQLYVRFWFEFDYVTDTDNSNTDFFRDPADLNHRVQLDGDRPRPRTIHFTDGGYDSRRSSVLAGQRWDLHEIMWDYDTSVWQWMKQANGVWTNTVVRTTTRTSGAELLISGPTVFALAQGNVENQPRNVGTIYYSQTIPTLEERETWFNAEKTQYGYVE